MFMDIIKSFFKYLAGSDVLEDRRRYYQIIGERSLGIKIVDVADDFKAFGIRYVPTLMELDGVRRLFNGQYVDSTIELLAAESIRMSEYFHNKRQRTLMDSAIRLSELGEEAVQRLEAIVQKSKGNSL